MTIREQDELGAAGRGRIGTRFHFLGGRSVCKGRDQKQPCQAAEVHAALDTSICSYVELSLLLERAPPAPKARNIVARGKRRASEARRPWDKSQMTASSERAEYIALIFRTFSALFNDCC